MSEKVDRVAEAIAGIPRIFVRAADDGCDEICRYGFGRECEIVVLSRVQPEDDVDGIKESIINKLRASAAIAAMRDPTEGMRFAAHKASREGSLYFAEMWRAAIDNVLDRSIKPTMRADSKLSDSYPLRPGTYAKIDDAEKAK